MADTRLTQGLDGLNKGGTFARHKRLCLNVRVNKGTIFKECDLWFQRHQNQMIQPETGMAQIYPQKEGTANVEDVQA